MKWKIENKFPDLILTSNSLSGEISTPSLAGEYDEEFYQADRRATFQLNLPEELDMSQDRLNVQLEVNMGEGECWDEVVEYRDGTPKFVYYPSRKSFEEAEATCVKDGGHLASITSASENDEVVAMSKGELTWLGGTYNRTQNSWSWSDGKGWRFSNFENTLVPKDEQKTAVGKKEHDFKWVMMSPQAQFPFICRPLQKVFRGVGIHTMSHPLSDLPNGTLSVIWHYQYKGKEVLDGQKHPNTGFRISWNTTNWESELVSDQQSGLVKEEWKKEHVTKPRYKEDNGGLVLMVNMVETAQELGFEPSRLQKELILHREESQPDLKATTTAFIWEEGLACPTGLVAEQFRNRSVHSYIKRINLTEDLLTSANVSYEAMRTGLLLYTSLLFCPTPINEAIQLTNFTKTIIEEQSPSTIIQALVNSLIKTEFKYAKNRKNLGHFYSTVYDVFSLKLNKILLRKLSSSAVDVINSTQPFLFGNKSMLKEEENTGIAELSSHPVHLISNEGIMFPSAFIPFCAYKTNMKLLGRYVDGLRFPVCDSFVPTILNGELCYSLDVDQALATAEDTREGSKGQLTLLLDYNIERSIHTAIAEEEDKSVETLHFEESMSSGDDTARIFVHTLAGYSGEGSGSYAMSSLKMMTATENFLAMSEKIRGGKTEEREDCKKRIFLESGPSVCGCIPWEHASQFSNKVIISLFTIHKSF